MEDSKTITYYNEHAEEFIENTWKADMSEVLRPLFKIHGARCAYIGWRLRQWTR